MRLLREAAEDSRGVHFLTMLDQGYYPGAGDDWERREPQVVDLGRDPLYEAISYAEAHETTMPRDLTAKLQVDLAEESHNELIGPVKDRGEPSGLVVRYGYIAAEWGNTERIEISFSVTKSYLSAVAALAFDQGLIRDVHDPVSNYVEDDIFDPPHNSKITWHHLLQQTSEWMGTLWGKPIWADSQSGQASDWVPREPGSHWAYNDVRINLLALSLLRVLRKPLPEVLNEFVMEPIGASDRWEWHGYRNSFVEIDGKSMQSVSGGGHWGGGLWASARDHARFGLLFMRGGRWKERQLLSERWIKMALTPCEVKPEYGYLWWLNTERRLFPVLPESSFFALGGGHNIIWIDPMLDLVAAVRGLTYEDCEEFMRRLLVALQSAG
jgi:CubicO group peptidase (beta-lactamase class C family)